MGLFSATPSSLTGTEISHYFDRNSIIKVLRPGDPITPSYEEFPCTSWNLKWGRKLEGLTIPIFDVKHSMNLPTVQPVDFSSFKNPTGGTFVMSLLLDEGIVSGADTRLTLADHTIAMDRLANGQEVERIDQKLFQAQYCSMATCGGADFCDKVHENMLDLLNNDEQVMLGAETVAAMFHQLMEIESLTLPRGMLRRDFGAGILMGIIDEGVTPRMFQFDLHANGVSYDECRTYAIDGQWYEEVADYLRVFYRRDMGVNEAFQLVRLCVNIAAGKALEQQGPDLACVGGRIHGSLLQSHWYVPLDLGPVVPTVLPPEYLQQLRDYRP